MNMDSKDSPGTHVGARTHLYTFPSIGHFLPDLRTISYGRFSLSWKCCELQKLASQSSGITMDERYLRNCVNHLCHLFRK